MRSVPFPSNLKGGAFAGACQISGQWGQGLWFCHIPTKHKKAMILWSFAISWVTGGVGFVRKSAKKNMVHHSLSSISISKQCHKIWVAYFQTSHARAFGRVTVPAPIAFAGGGPGQLCEGSCRHSFGKVKNLEVIAMFQYVSICVNVFHI